MSGKQPIADRIKDRPKEDTRIEYADSADKGMHIRMVRETDARVQEMQRRGYEVAKPEDIASHSGYVGTDGNVHFKDRIAMKIPKEIVAEREQRRLDLDRARREQAKQIDRRNHIESYESQESGGTRWI